ncbi:tetratricopeptide repeat protein [Streptomyces sp. AC550_RSS872]|uniref:tetratricopeptide repeat protein n=1 Tax=Streptomyces sp. AC550_RSS872 TaxID=2823689 RepID=UPI001C25B51F|nr:tetratricopeptide repeat protein [Streptomyces sp. AC550_RSS872]
MTSMEPPQQPEPDGLRSLDELAARLGELRTWAGLSVREVHRRVARARRARGVPEEPSYDTVHRCFRLGRTRLNADLLAEIAQVLGAEGARWRRAHARVVGDATEAAVVTVLDAPPADLPAFTGRRGELATLLAARAPAVSVIEGMAGVGKTTLAVHAAHRLRRLRRVDTVLWVDLRGYAPGMAPADPAAVLDGFLRLLGMSPDRIRLLDLPGRAREFRARLAGRRALIGLDNAISAEQVHPLLPGPDAPACPALVTTRRRITGLPEARRLPLEAFTPAESMELLRRAMGNGPVDDPETAGRIAASVGHLPLALGVVAGRISRGGSGWTLTDHLERLNDHRARLTVDDGVELALRLSYEQLDPPHRRLFRLLALHPGPTVDAYAAAALAGDDLATARDGLDALFRASLLRQPDLGRYEFHDLVHVYAASRSHDEDPARARRAALSRLLDHHRYAASLAMDHFAPHERRRRPSAGTSGTPAPELAGWEEATAWLNAERAGLIATAVHAAGHPETHDRPDHCGHMSAILSRYLGIGGHYREAEALHAHGARTSSDPGTRGWALAGLGTTRWRLGRYPETADALRQALAAFRGAGDLAGQGWALGNLGHVHRHLGEVDAARTCFEDAGAVALALVRGGVEAAPRGVMYEPLGRYPETYTAAEEAVTMGKQVLALARAFGDRVSEANVLVSLGAVHREAGNRPEALEHLLHALEIMRETGNRFAEVDVLVELGATLREFNAPLKARQRCEEAAALAARLCDRYQQARAHDGIAHCHALLDDPEAARTHWQEAHRLFTELGAPEADDVAARAARCAGRRDSPQRGREGSEADPPVASGSC